MVLDDEDDIYTLANRNEEATKQRFDLMVQELANVVQQHRSRFTEHVMEDRLGHCGQQCLSKVLSTAARWAPSRSSIRCSVNLLLCCCTTLASSCTIRSNLCVAACSTRISGSECRLRQPTQFLVIPL